MMHVVRQHGNCSAWKEEVSSIKGGDPFRDNNHFYSPITVVTDRNETKKKDNLTKQIDYSHITINNHAQ